MERGDDAASGAWGGRYKIEHCYKGRLHSCYAQLSGGSEPTMTSCHEKFTGTVDYMVWGKLCAHSG